MEFQTRQQQLIVARNDYAKQKLLLARTIGLPPGQEFNLTDKAPYKPLDSDEGGAGVAASVLHRAATIMRRRKR